MLLNHIFLLQRHSMPQKQSILLDREASAVGFKITTDHEKEAMSRIFQGMTKTHLLVEILRVLKHFLVHLPRLIVIWASDAELLHFLKLMNSKNAQGVATMGPSLFPETS